MRRQPSYESVSLHAQRVLDEQSAEETFNLIAATTIQNTNCSLTLIFHRFRNRSMDIWGTNTFELEKATQGFLSRVLGKEGKKFV